MSTFQQMKTNVMGRQFSSQNYDSYVGDKLNEAQVYVARELDYRGLVEEETYATTAGTPTLALPSDFLRPFAFTQTDTDEKLRLGQLELADYDLLDTETEGRPSEYTFDGANLLLYPTPDAEYNYQLRYYRAPATMIAGSEPEIPHVEPVLEAYALSMAFERENDMAQSDRYWGRFQERLKKLQTELHQDTNDPNQAQVVPGMWVNDTLFWPNPQRP